MAKQRNPEEIVTAYTAGADAAPPAYPGQPANVRAAQLPAYVAPRISMWAKAAVFCAVLGIFFPWAGAGAVVCGMVGLFLKDEAKHGRAMSIGAVVGGTIELVFVFLLLGIWDRR